MIDQRQAADGFFGFVNRLGDIALDTFTDLAPVWAAQQLKVDSKDHLATPVFQNTPGNNRVDVEPTTATNRGILPDSLSVGGFNVDTNMVLLGGLGVAVFLLVLRK